MKPKKRRSGPHVRMSKFSVFKAVCTDPRAFFRFFLPFAKKFARSRDPCSACRRSIHDIWSRTGISSMMKNEIKLDRELLIIPRFPRFLPRHPEAQTGWGDPEEGEGGLNVKVKVFTNAIL